MVAEIVSRRGPRGASAVLGISRHTLAQILAGMGVQGGTIAVLREAARRREQAA
jgi:hypothetical protein